jgi:hypothetical protein
MTIPRNKNITKQLNSYSYVIVITLQDLLQRTKRAFNHFKSINKATKKISTCYTSSNCLNLKLKTKI